jgi:hypothetical protein
MADGDARGVVYGCPCGSYRGRNVLDRRMQPIDRGRCDHASFPVEVLSVEGGKKKIAHCLRCGRSGSVHASSTEALMALRKEPRLGVEKTG